MLYRLACRYFQNLTRERNYPKFSTQFEITTDVILQSLIKVFVKLILVCCVNYFIYDIRCILKFYKMNACFNVAKSQCNNSNNRTNIEPCWNASYNETHYFVIIYFPTFISFLSTCFTETNFCISYDPKWACYLWTFLES